MRLASVTTPFLFVLVSCIGDEAPIDDEGFVVDGKTDGVNEFKLTLTTTSGVIRAKESPKLPGAPSGTTKFTCATDDRTDEGWRLICTRGKEELRLLWGPDDRVGATVYLKTTSQPDRRGYYRCSATTAAANEWPTEISCTAKQPKTIIDGQLVSPFSSSIDGIGILNSHAVGTNLYRGMKPFRDADYDDLKTLGVDAVLIFKKATHADEVEVETAALDAIGVPADRVVNVPFLWKDFTSFEEPCKQTVRSLKLLHDWTASGKTAFFHCTVGEDRTGYLAGLYRLLTETTTVRDTFEQELCERGYSSGNPQKPFIAVVTQVDGDVTPLYLKMAFKIANGELTTTSLDESVCATDPESDPLFTGAEWTPTAYRCLPSSRYRL